MIFNKTGCLLLSVFALAALSAGAVRPAEATSLAPAFLDSKTHIDLRLPMPVDPAQLTGRVSVFCGGKAVPIAHVEAAPLGQEGLAPSAPDPQEVVLAGTLQGALGGTNWQTDGAQTRMREVAPGVYGLTVHLPPGSYQYKVTRGGTWAENWGQGFQPGGTNLTLTVRHTSWVRFMVNFNQKTILNSVQNPQQLPPPTGPAPTPAAVPVKTIARLTRNLLIVLVRPLGPRDIVRPMAVRLPDGTEYTVYARDVLSGPEYQYSGDDLGSTYTPTRTTFKVWCPVAASASLLLYSQATGGSARSVPMHRGASGVWSVAVPGNLNGIFYQYQFMSYGAPHTAPDLYGRAASEDLRRSMVVDLAQTNPSGWQTVPAPPLRQPTDAVVYELHLRDFTIDPSSGVPAPLRGKYLGLIAPGTHVPGTTVPTGLAYLRHLGVTHVQVMPFESFNPGDGGGYDWGYDTDLFNVPEPRYSTNPQNPFQVIRQVKMMVEGLHRAHIGMIMDVVYNHSVPVSGEASPFWATVPYYYFRTDFAGNLLNESGVGNALDDSHPMVRKFICDSLVYWARQYHVDGFRFDLLGMFTPQTVSAISEALHQVRPDILLYGEPWTGGGPVRFGKGAQRGLGVAVFNDNFRNIVRGDLDGTVAGFALGGGGKTATLRTVISGSPDFAAAPTESINYVSIHDDMTLLDKIQKTLPNADTTTDQRILKLAGAMVLLSQGVPVLEGGAELGRTKEGSTNSYNLGDSVNHFAWKRGLAFRSVSDFYRQLIAVRRAHPAFRCATAAQVQETLAFLSSKRLPPDTIAFTLDGAPTGDSWQRTLVIFHGTASAAPLLLPGGPWKVALSSDPLPVQTGASETLALSPFSAYVLYQTRK